DPPGGCHCATLRSYCRIYFVFYCAGDHRALHSFPTRRSSDLLVVLPGHWNLAAAPSGAMHPARQAGEQIPQIDIVERERAAAELLLPPRGRPELLSRTMAPQLIVGGAFFRIPQSFIGFAELLELLFGVPFLGNVRMILSRELRVHVFDVHGV